MTKRLITLFLALLPIALQAQTAPENYTYVCATSNPNISLIKDNELGLEYLYDTGDANGPFIDVGGAALCTLTGKGNANSNTYFVSDGGLRSNWRGNYNSGNARWYRTTLDAVTHVNKMNHGISTMKGVEYFRNMTQLTIICNPNNGAYPGRIDNLDLSKNVALTTLNINYSNLPITTLKVSNTQLTTLPLNRLSTSALVNFYAENTRLTTINLSSFSSLEVVNISNNTPVSSLTLPSYPYRLKLLHLTGVAITSLNLSGADLLNELILKDITTFTGAVGNPPLTLPTQKMNLRKLDMRGSNLHTFYDHTSPLDLRSYLLLVSNDGELLFDEKDEAEQRDGFVRFMSADLTEVNPLGNIHIRNNNAAEDTYIAEEHEDTIYYTLWPNLKKLHVIGDVDCVILPENRTEFTISCENAPNLTVDFGTQPQLTTLLVENIPSLDVSSCTALRELYYRGSLSQNLILGEAGQLRYLNLRKSGVKKLDLTGKAPLLHTLITSFSAIEDLNVSGHDKLSTLEFHPSDQGIAEEGMTLAQWSENWKLHKLNVSGCTALPGIFEITSSESWKRYCNIDTLIAQNCTNFKTIQCYNNMLTHLDLSGCTNLQKLFISQGLLTGKGDINITGCDLLESFVAHRHHWESLDFLLVPSETRSADAIANLKQLQVNGGTYTLHDENGVPYARHDSLKYTTRLRSIDLTHLDPENFTMLLCEDNLLTKLDLSVIGPGLTFIQCARNMLTTVDLHHLNFTNLKGYEITPEDAQYGQQSRWSPQVGYVSAEIVRAQGTGDEARKKDWIALHLPNGGYTHKLDNTAKLYPNLYAARNNGDPIAGEQPWMCTVSDANDASITGNTFAGCNFDATAYRSGQYLFVHSLDELISENVGKWNDHELDGKVVLYKFNTGYNQEVDEHNVPILDQDGNVAKRNTSNYLDPHIEVRMHLWPHMLNINPASKSGTGVDYYSSTIYLDYDALIPEGVKCYFISGLTKDDVTPEANIGVKFKMEPFGEGGNAEGVNHILPAYTPVYVRSTVDPGLYDFQPLWEFDYLGWENVRGTDYHTLHGVESEPGRKTKAEYEEALAAAQTLKANTPNILTGWLGVKSTTTDMEAEDYNVYTQANDTVTPRHVLTLTRNKLAGTNAIGFWPYTGTTIAPHRCYITGEDYNKALKAANLDDAGNIGGTFFFDDNTTAITTVNANTNVSTDDSWYTLGGQRLNSRPAHSGVYIKKGKKVVIR